MHFRPSLVLYVLSHLSFRSAAHCLRSRPCKTDVCSNGVSLIRVLSVAIPRSFAYSQLLAGDCRHCQSRPSQMQVELHLHFIRDLDR